MKSTTVRRLGYTARCFKLYEVPRSTFSPFAQRKIPEHKILRELANREHKTRVGYFERAQQAYLKGEGAEAKELSEAGKRHGLKMDEYNKQASTIIFETNNADRERNEIDLHGLFVKGMVSQMMIGCIN